MYLCRRVSTINGNGLSSVGSFGLRGNADGDNIVHITKSVKALDRNGDVVGLYHLKSHQYWQRWGAKEFYGDADCVCYKLDI